MKLTELINKHGLITEQSISDQWALYSAKGHTKGEIVMLAIAQGESLDIIVTRQFEETDTSSVVLKLNRFDLVLDAVLTAWVKG
jgi:hypothetical protein